MSARTPLKSTRAMAARSSTSARSRRVAFSRSRIPASTLRTLSTEIKSLDIPRASYALNTTGSVTPLNLIRAGSSFFNRIGRRIELRSIHMKGTINQIRTTNSWDYVRVMIVYDRQTNGALPAIADILQSTDQAGTNTTTSFSDINLNNRDRFQVLRDLRICLPSFTLTAGQVTNPGFVDPVSQTFNIKEFKKIKSEITQYKTDSSPADISDIATGGLFLVTLGFQAAGSEGFDADLEFRLRYAYK